MARFLVIGLNAMGRTLARELVRRGADVTIGDQSEQRTRRLKDIVTRAVTLDTTDRPSLTSLDVPKFDHVIVCMGHEFEAAERTTLALLDLGAKGVTNLATSRQRRDILLRIGAQRVLTPGLLQARNLAVELTEKLIHSFWFVNDEQGLAEIVLQVALELEPGALDSWFGPRVRFVASRRKAGAEDREEGFRIDVSKSSRLEPGDSILLFGTPEDIAEMVRKKLV